MVVAVAKLGILAYQTLVGLPSWHHHHHQVAGWTMAVVGAGSSFTSITGKIDATTAGDFGSYMELAPGSGLQTGATFQFNFTTTHAVGIMLAPRPLSDDSNPGIALLRVVPAYGYNNQCILVACAHAFTVTALHNVWSPLPTAVNRGAPYSYKVAAIDTTLELAVTEPFDTMQKAAKTVDVTLTAAEITATSNPATFKASRLQNTGVPAPPQLDPVVEAGSVKIPYRNFGVSRGITRGDSKISIALPVLDDDYVNWKETGPWRTGTVSITSTMYPTLTSTWQKFDISPGASIYAILGKGMWWQSAVVYHQFGGVGSLCHTMAPLLPACTITFLVCLLVHRTALRVAVATCQRATVPLVLRPWMPLRSQEFTPP